MNNFIWTASVDAQKDLVPLPLQDTTNGQEGKFEFTSGVQDSVVHTITPESAPETKTRIDYDQLATEHAELITQGKNSVEIAQWIGDKLNIPSWKAGEFHGERKVLSSPETYEEIARFRRFVRTLGTPFGPANQSSENHSKYFLLDGFVQNALFGSANMTQVNARLDTFHADWEKMGDDFDAKTQYLMENVGLDIKGDWKKLTGMRRSEGDFIRSGSFIMSGLMSDVNSVYSLRLLKDDLNKSARNASEATLCFLA